jgi:hypothetical protein
MLVFHCVASLSAHHSPLPCKLTNGLRASGPATLQTCGPADLRGEAMSHDGGILT